MDNATFTGFKGYHTIKLLAPAYRDSWRVSFPWRRRWKWSLMGRNHGASGVVHGATQKRSQIRTDCGLTQRHRLPFESLSNDFSRGKSCCAATSAKGSWNDNKSDRRELLCLSSHSDLVKHKTKENFNSCCRFLKGMEASVPIDPNATAWKIWFRTDCFRSLTSWNGLVIDVEPKNENRSPGWHWWSGRIERESDWLEELSRDRPLVFIN